MRYVDAGYSIVLGILFLYGVLLVWRRRRLTRGGRAGLAASRPRGRPVTTAPAGCRQRHRDALRAPSDPAPCPTLSTAGAIACATRWSASFSSVALVFLLAKGIGSALDFYLTADQAVAQRATLGTKTFNVEGLVEPGSIHATPQGVDFVVTSGSTSLQVDNTGQPAPALPGRHPGHRRRPLPRRRLRLRSDPGEALVELHRGPSRTGHRSERDEAMIAPTGRHPGRPLRSSR